MFLIEKGVGKARVSSSSFKQLVMHNIMVAQVVMMDMDLYNLFMVGMYLLKRPQKQICGLSLIIKKTCVANLEFDSNAQHDHGGRDAF